ncbi:MAG: hypothetical protein ABFD79_09980 [Phycisphaerales bacterium]
MNYEEYYDFAYTPEEKGWVHIPAGHNSIEEYRKTYDKLRAKK